MNIKQKFFFKKPPQYVCPIHGDIGEQTLNSTIPGHEMILCLRCYLETLKEIGVCEVKEKNHVD